MTRLEAVRRICVKIVMGSCSESSACESTKPWKVFSTSRHASVAMPMHSATPTEEWRSWMSYSSPNMPALMVPAAMPAVTEDESPASSSATAKMIVAAEPRMGESVAAAVARSSTTTPRVKNVVAARITMAEFIAQPTPIEKSVSKSS